MTNCKHPEELRSHRWFGWTVKPTTMLYRNFPAMETGELLLSETH